MARTKGALKKKLFPTTALFFNETGKEGGYYNKVVEKNGQFLDSPRNHNASIFFHLDLYMGTVSFLFFFVFPVLRGIYT